MRHRAASRRIWESLSAFQLANEKQKKSHRRMGGGVHRAVSPLFGRDLRPR
jgi:hypothetical protein